MNFFFPDSSRPFLVPCGALPGLPDSPTVKLFHPFLVPYDCRLEKVQEKRGETSRFKVDFINNWQEIGAECLAYRCKPPNLTQKAANSPQVNDVRWIGGSTGYSKAQDSEHPRQISNWQRLQVHTFPRGISRWVQIGHLVMGDPSVSGWGPWVEGLSEGAIECMAVFPAGDWRRLRDSITLSLPNPTH